LVEDDDMMEDGPDEVIPLKTKPGPKPPATRSVEVACPDCGCDYVIPVMQITINKSFAGNKLQIAWPSRDGVNDTALLACPACAIIYQIKPDGSMVKSNQNWGLRKPQKKKD